MIRDISKPSMKGIGFGLIVGAISMLVVYMLECFNAGTACALSGAGPFLLYCGIGFMVVGICCLIYGLLKST